MFLILAVCTVGSASKSSVMLISSQCAWADVQERLLSGRFAEGRGRGSHTSVCGQEEPGITMRVKLATRRAA